MIIFKYELKQLKKNIIIWAISMGGLIFLMLPVYIGFTVSGGEDVAAMEAMQNNPMFDVIGVSAEFITTPIGMLGFLTTFAAIAAAIHGMSIAFSSHTKEYTTKSAEFLLTKPHSRGKVFWGKFFACVAAVWIVGLAYMLGAALALLTIKDISVDWWLFVLIAKTLPLISLMFAVLGVVAGAFWSNVRTPALISSCVMFALFCVNSVAKKINVPLLQYFTPFGFFTSLDIVETGFYEWNFVVWYFIVGAGLLFISYKKFLKKDVIFAG